MIETSPDQPAYPRRRRLSSQRPLTAAESSAFSVTQRRRLNFEQRRVSYQREQIRIRLST